MLLPHLKSEKFIEIPENPEHMAQRDLDTLVRPVAEGFLRSQPSKNELLSQLQQIARRQASRPPWMPRTKDSSIGPDSEKTSQAGSQPIPTRVSTFPELGDVTIDIPAYYGDPMYSVDSNHPALLQMALLTIFDAATPDAAGRTVRGIQTELDALIPAENRWWVPPETTLTPKSAAENPAIAAEVLATAEALGNVRILDVVGPHAASMAADVLLGTGSWRHGARIVVDGWQPSDNSRLRSVTGASFAGWADDTGQGFVLAVIGGGWDEEANVYPLGHRLHTYVAWWTAPQISETENFGSLHRVVLHCPGEDVCQRGGCLTTLDDELLAAAGLVLADAEVTTSIAAGADWAADAYRASLLGSIDDEPDEVLSIGIQPLLAAGWEEVSSGSSELGDVDVLLTRREKLLAVAYRPLSRELVFTDGHEDLDILCQILADDGGLLKDDDGVSHVDRKAISDTWSDSVLSLIEKYLRHDLTSDVALINPVNILVAGIWPWGTGVTSTDEDRNLLQRQIDLTLAQTGLLGSDQD